MSLKNRFWLFVYGNPNILGCILGLVGVALFFAGITDQGWLPITLGLYALGWVAGWTMLPGQDGDLTASLQRESLEDELNELVKRSAKQLPAHAAEALKRIQGLTLELLERMRQGDPLLVEQAHHIEQTVRNYLPNTLESYLRLPRMYTRMHVIKNGKTADGMLIEQMNTLESGLQGMLENVAADDAQTLLANGRFLEAKFGRSESFAANQ